MLLAEVNAVELIAHVKGLATKFHPRLPKEPELSTETAEFAVKSDIDKLRAWMGVVPVKPMTPGAVRTPFEKDVPLAVKVPTLAM